MWDCSCSLSFLPWAGFISALRPSVYILPTDGRVGESHFTLLPTYDDGRARMTNGFNERWHSLEPNWGKFFSNEKDPHFYPRLSEFIESKYFILKAPFDFDLTWLCLIGWMEFPHFTQNIRKMRQLLTPKLTSFLAYLWWANSFLSFINKC